MAWIFKKRKQLIETSELAISLFKENKVISDASMERYVKTLKRFAEFLLTKRKSLLDARAKEVYEFLEGDLEKRATEKAIISSFYRTMIRLGHYKGANPVAELPKLIEKINKKSRKRGENIAGSESEAELSDDDYAALELENLILNELGEEGEPQKITPEKPEQNYRKLMSAKDFEDLILKTSHIRDRTVLELLWWTGLRPLELCELRVKDIDLVKRRIYVRGKRVIERTILMNKRLQKVLERYLEWRNRQLAPTDKLIITPRSKEPLSSSALAGFLSRLQRDKPRKERFTTRDFRRRAIINYYYMTRDIVATHRFAGMKSTAATVNLINQILEERKVSSIDELAELTEFKEGLVTPALKEEKDEEEKEKDKEKLKKKPQKITILLTPEEQELLIKAGITPSSAIRGMLSLREFYRQLAPQGGGFAPSAGFGGGMNIPAAPRPAVSSAPRAPRPTSSGPKMPLPRPGGGGGGGGASPAAYISELKEILKKRRQKSDQEIAEAEKKEEEEKKKKEMETTTPSPPAPSGGPNIGGEPKITMMKKGPNAPKF